MRQNKKIYNITSLLTSNEITNSTNVWCLQFLLNFDQFGDTVVHFLDGFELSKSHTSLVRDVVDATFSFGVLTSGTTDLQVVFASDLLQLGLVGSEFGYFDVYGCTYRSSQVGWAEGQESKPKKENRCTDIHLF